MTDATRRLQEIDPRTRTTIGEPRPLESFADAKVLIVLGDPGAGKTHLLRGSGATYRTAKRAVDAAAPALTGRWAIDGLDEVSGDIGDALATLLNRLEAASAPSVILSCRAQEWQEAGALRDFEDVYGAGAVRIVRLEPLDDEGAVAVLEGLVRDPASFIAEARDRGLGELLKNPNDLTLLARAAGAGWPSTRAELLEAATDVVLLEDNATHQRRSDWRLEDLHGPVGWICASLLISGADELTADGGELGDPKAAGLAREHVRAALHSRAFTSTASGKVQPAHRTIAEFLAGRWLGQVATTALAQARLRALVCASDGQPPPSLRGLFAWAVNFMPPEHARHWLAADPIGLVLHGDVALLGPRQKLDLLDALAVQAAHDPDLGGWGEDGARWSALLMPETARRVSEVLKDVAVPEVLRVRLLDGAAAAPSPSALVPTLLQLADDPAAPGYIRERAAQAYLKAGAPEAPVLALLERLNRTPAEDKDFGIRGAILRALPSLTPDQVADVAAELAKSRSEVRRGRIAYAFEAFGPASLEALLDKLLALPAPKPQGPREPSSAQTELSQVLARVITRLVKEAPSAFTDERLIALHKRQVLTTCTFPPRTKEALVKLAEGAGSAALKLFKADVLPGPLDKLWGRFVDALDLGGLLPNDGPLWALLVEELKRTSDPALAVELGGVIISSAFNRPFPDDVFESLYELVTTRPDLASLVEPLTTRPPRDWSKRQRKREAERQAQVDAALQTWRDHFSASRANVASWTDAAGLAWLADLYWGHFEGEVGGFSEEARFKNLVLGLGQPLADDIAADLMSGVRKAPTASFGVGRTAVAAMDLLHHHQPQAIEDPSIISDGLASELLIAWLEANIEVRDPYSGEELGDRSWPARLIATRSAAVEARFLAIAGAGLRKPKQHVLGVYPLAHSPILSPVRQDWAIKLLSAELKPSLLHATDLFHAALSNPGDARLLPLASRALSQKLTKDAEMRWTAAGWRLDPVTYQASLVGLLAKATPALAWSAIHTLRADERHGGSWAHLSEDQLSTLLPLLAARFPYAPKPGRIWGGTTNAWDGSDIVDAVTRALADRGTRRSRDFLLQLSEDSRLASHAETFRRAALAAAEGARQRELASPRDLREVSTGLLGGPPSTLPEAIAIVVEELRDLEAFYRKGAGSNWRKFWNLTNDSRSTQVTTIKAENECRNYLVTDLSQRLRTFDMRAEELTANEDRIDIAVYHRAEMFPIEVKLDDNAELWTAASGQLSARYVRDYRAAGLGIYLVLWSQQGRGKRMKAPPPGTALPASAPELESSLTALLSGPDKDAVYVVVMDLAKAP